MGREWGAERVGWGQILKGLKYTNKFYSVVHEGS